MSLLLDALRKSEDRRRLGQAPALELPARSGLAGRRRRVRRAWLPWVVSLGLVLGLAGAGTWWMLKPEPPLVPVAAPEAPEAADPAVTMGPPPVSRAEPEPSAAPPVAQVPDARVIAEVPAEPEIPSEPAPAVADTAAGTEQVPEPAESDSSARARIADAEEIAGVLAGDGADPVVAEVEPETERFRPRAPEYVNRWDLPTAIRQDLPELRLSIHVFSANPTERFVLVNGERWVEGDEVAPGVRLHEIRREGAVMEFREYRFLVE